MKCGSVILLLLCRVSCSGGLLLTPEMSVFLSLESLIAEKQIWLGDRILCAMFFQLLQLFVVLSCLRFSKILNLKQICQARPQLTFLFWWDGLSLFDYLSMSVFLGFVPIWVKKIADPVQIFIQRRMFSVCWFWVFLSDVLWPYNHLLQSSCVWDVCLLGFCDDLGWIAKLSLDTLVLMCWAWLLGCWTAKCS